MRIEKLYINNFKSLVEFELINPAPFSVFVGPNGAGKSNIFEALEYLNIAEKTDVSNVDKYFGGKEDFFNFNAKDNNLRIDISMQSGFGVNFYKDLNENFTTVASSFFNNYTKEEILKFKSQHPTRYLDWKQLFDGFGKLYASGVSELKLNPTDDSKLSFNSSNLEKVLRRILLNEDIREEFLEWLQLLVPEFEKIEIISDEVDGEAKLRIVEKYSKRPFKKKLISDGTRNILSLLCLVYQSDEPQFLCIEEPENGLNPKVISSLVGFFRDKCAEKGHYIWLNTHSQSLVAQLTVDEIIVVDKIKGITKAKQFKNLELNGLNMDDAWLTNALGGGLPW